MVKLTLPFCLGLIVNLAVIAAPPNVVIVLSDDQGYGELSVHGNPVVQTPHLDRLHSESIRFTDFHVAPMCTPTRGQLLTGMDALRNGAMNVSSGRTLLRRELLTMPQMFAGAGYATGLFGKWHLGDSYPYRPQDRGFGESLWFPSSHIGSLPDVWENHYFDDTYERNGTRVKYRGYTTDVFFDEAKAWMKTQSSQRKPFLCCIPTAAPHAPHFVPARYRESVVKRFATAKAGLPELTKERTEQLIRYLAMIENLDKNMGHLETFLKDSGLRDNTIVVFLTDNGSTFGASYFNTGMRGQKISLWEGGHRVPCFVRWPERKLRTAGDVPGLTQVQDLLPTLLDLCAIPAPATAKFDGMNLGDVLRGKAEPPGDRMLVINYSRMPSSTVTFTKANPAIPCREGAAVLWKRWRLLEDRELYDLESDPKQERNVIADHADVAAKMRQHLDAWWNGVKDTCAEFQPSVIGAAEQNPVVLTGCEWADVFIDQQTQVRRGIPRNGFWHIDVAKAGTYEIDARRFPAESGLGLNDSVKLTRVTDGTLIAGPAFAVAKVKLQIGKDIQVTNVAKDAKGARFQVELPAGRTTLQTWLQDADGKDIAGAYYVTVLRK